MDAVKSLIGGGFATRVRSLPGLQIGLNEGKKLLCILANNFGLIFCGQETN